MSVLYKSGGSTVPGSCSISNGAMHRISFLLLGKKISVVALNRTTQQRKVSSSVVHLPVADQQTLINPPDPDQDNHL